MVSPRTLRKTLLGGDVAVAYAILVALYLLKFVPFQPTQIPPYLLIVAYDFVEVAVPILTPYYPVGFPLFLYLLAIVGAGVTRILRSGDNEQFAWYQTLGGVCLLIGTLSLVFGAFVGGPVVSPTDNLTPLAITGATGIVFLVAAWWLLDRPSIRSLNPT